MTPAPGFTDLVASMMRSTAEDRVSGTVRVRTVTEFGYRLMRLDDKVRCESLDGYVHFIAGRYQVWTPDPESGLVRAEARTEAWFSTPDDLDFGVGRPRADRWEGDDFTRPVGVPEPTTFLGRPAWQVDLAPPPHKPYRLTLVVDAATGLVLREANDGVGSFSEWTELDTAAELSEDLFVWDGARDRPVPPVAPVERPVLDEDRASTAEHVEILDAALPALATLLRTSELGARAVLDLQVRRFAGVERERLVAERDEIQTRLRQR